MLDLRTLLTPPSVCQQHGSAMKDRRKGWFWHCAYSGRNMGVSRTMPSCLCKQALGDARAALARTEPRQEMEGKA